MKKYLVFILPVLMFLLPSCNEDGTKNDDNLKAQLIGNWVLSSEQTGAKDETIRLTFGYRLDADGKFIHTESVRTLGLEGALVKEKMMSVRGTWSVKKAQLELSYDLNSLNFVGYTETEQQAQYKKYKNENLMLQDMHAQGDPYGMLITITTANGKTYLQLGSINGMFEKTTIPVLAPEQEKD